MISSPQPSKWAKQSGLSINQPINLVGYLSASRKSEMCRWVQLPPFRTTANHYGTEFDTVRSVGGRKGQRLVLHLSLSSSQSQLLPDPACSGQVVATTTRALSAKHWLSQLRPSFSTASLCPFWDNSYQDLDSFLSGQHRAPPSPCNTPPRPVKDAVPTALKTMVQIQRQDKLNNDISNSATRGPLRTHGPKSPRSRAPNTLPSWILTGRPNASIKPQRK